MYVKKPNWLRFSSWRLSLQKRWPFTTSMYYKIAVYNAQYAGHNRDPSAPGLFVIISRCRLIIIMMSKDRQQSKSVTSKMAESETTRRPRGNWIHQKQKSLKHFQTKYFLHCHFDFQCLRFFFKITNITFLIKPLSGMYEELFSDISGVTTPVTIHALDP